MRLSPEHILKALGLPFVCLAMFGLAGGHLAVFQAVAWGQMLWSYSQDTGSLLAGAEKTFSGKYPCSMCRKVAEQTQKEQKAPAIFKVDKQLEVYVMLAALSVRQPAGRDVTYFLPDFLFSTRREAPPVPVPIAAV